MRKYKFIMIAFFCSILFNIAIHHFDNKYTYNDLEALCGVVDYTSPSQNMHFLTQQWEFYQDQLLTPEMFQTQKYIPTRYIDIGQFGGYELGDLSHSPYGQATYRLRIYDEPDQVMTLQIPEIYSAYQLYINGDLIYKSGEVKKQTYKAQVLSTSITFTTKACNEIVFQISNYDHYYSGMIYPIAYGSQQQINIYQSFHTLVKGLQSFLPLVMGVVCLFSYLFAGKSTRDGYFSLVCLTYLGYILYTIIHLIFPNQSFLWYRIEDLNYYLLVYFVMLLVLQQYQYKIARKWVIIGMIFLFCCLTVPAFLIIDYSNIIYIMSHIGQFMKYLLSMIMIFIILKKAQNSYFQPLTGLIIFFVVSLNMDNTFWYEPIYWGWGSEISGFILIAYFSIVMVQEKIELYQNYKELNYTKEHLKDYIFDVAHDLKAPAASLNGYIELLNSGIAEKQHKEDYFLEQMAKKVDILSQRIALLQTLDLDKDMNLEKEYLSIYSLILPLEEKYQLLLNNKGLHIYIEGEDYELLIDPQKIMICLENILMNAVEYSIPETVITIKLCQDELSYQIHITNTGKEISQESQKHIFERHYTTGQGEHSGLGLSICQKIMQAHMGVIEVYSQLQKTSFIMKFMKK